MKIAVDLHHTLEVKQPIVETLHCFFNEWSFAVVRLKIIVRDVDFWIIVTSVEFIFEGIVDSNTSPEPFKGFGYVRFWDRLLNAEF